MLLAAVRRLYSCHADATQRVFEAAAGLTPEQFTATVVKGQRPLRDTLVHLCTTQGVHLSWWDRSLSGEESFARRYPPTDYPDVVSVGVLWDGVRSDAEAFLGTLASDADLARIYRRSVGGEPRERPLWLMLLHVANHGTQHRSEAALLLTALDHSPGDLDLL